eukprot:1820701-Lingulodinium_polyedra.AAC.1
MVVVDCAGTDIDFSATQFDDKFQLPDWATRYFQTLNTVKIGSGDLNDFLLPDEHARHLIEATHKTAASSFKEVKDPKYKVDHLQIFQEAGLDWPPDLENIPGLANGCSHLPQRQQEIAYYQAARSREPEKMNEES